MRRITRGVAALCVACAAVAPALAAQGGPPPRVRDPFPPGGIERRAMVEQQLREAFARTVKERLALTDEQVTRLQEVNRRFADERIGLMREEFRLRRELRRALATGDSTRGTTGTAALLDGVLDIQRRRLDVQQREQQALAEFLTPEQRARYLALQDQLRRRVQARLDSTRGARPPGARGGGPPF